MGPWSLAGCDSIDAPPVDVDVSLREAVVTAMGLQDGESWVVVASGEVRGWGRRYCDAGGCLEPFEIDPVELGGPAVEVRGNGTFMATVMADGTVLGFGPALADASEPALVDVGGTAVGLAVGLDFLCARLASGKVACRGLPGSPDPAWLPSAPFVDDAVEITAGAEHVCARRTAGVVTCWGGNDAGQLGGAGTSAMTLTFSSAATRVVAGSEHTCVRLDDGAVQCWGRNVEGQLGHRGTGVGTVPLAEPATEIAAGAEHTCAIGSITGSLDCWGSNAYGQLGAGEDSSAGIRRVGLGGLRAIAIFAGATARTTFAVLETGGLRGWGRDDWGQTGYGDRFRDDGEATRIVGELPDIPIFIPPDED